MNTILKTIRQQNTITKPVCVSGFGYWSGQDITIEFRPADVDRGITFVRESDGALQRIPARVEYREDVPRRTNLRRHSTNVDMVEHVVAALAGLQIDNCEVHCNNVEMPGCDGSSHEFVQALTNAGIQAQDAPRQALIVERVVRFGDSECWIEAKPVSNAANASLMILEYRLDYGPASVIPKQTCRLEVTPSSFVAELSQARTFILAHEAAALQKAGLGQRATTNDLIVFGEDGPIDTSLRYSNECARHKTLDMVGDLALGGIDLIGEFTAYRTGHRYNSELVRVLLEEHNIRSDLLNCA